MMQEGAQADFAPTAAVLRDGRRVTIRPVRPEDADAIQVAFARLSAETRYTRFMAPVRELPRSVLERTVHPIASRELALVAVAHSDAGDIVVGGARYITEPDMRTCEFAVTIADEWQGAGLASRMLKELVASARAYGLNRMEGYVLASNRPMLDLARRLGFEAIASEEGPTVKLVRLDLGND